MWAMDISGVTPGSRANWAYATTQADFVVATAEARWLPRGMLRESEVQRAGGSTVGATADGYWRGASLQRDIKSKRVLETHTILSSPLLAFPHSCTSTLSTSHLPRLRRSLHTSHPHIILRHMRTADDL